MGQAEWKVEASYSDIQELLEATKRAEIECARLREKLANTQLGDVDGSLARQLAGSLRDAIKIVQWAIGNYDPETVIGWPHEALVEVAKSILALPGASVIETEWASDALRFAKFAAVVDRFRKEGRQKELAGIPRSSLGGTGYEIAAQQLLRQGPPQPVTTPTTPAPSAQDAVQQEAGNGHSGSDPQGGSGPVAPA